MSYKSEINETETEISLFGKITIDKATGVVTIDNITVPLLKLSSGFGYEILDEGVFAGITFRRSGVTPPENGAKLQAYLDSPSASVEFRTNLPNGWSFEGNLGVSGQVEGTSFKVIGMNTAPSSSSDTGVLGEIRITADYIYVCVATDTWKRVAISTW